MLTNALSENTEPKAKTENLKVKKRLMINYLLLKDYFNQNPFSEFLIKSRLLILPKLVPKVPKRKDV